MIVVNDTRFRGLLRWYPRAWRERNGDAMVDTMLEDAGRQGRGSPTASEGFSAAVYGLGTRMDARIALWCALIALAFAAAAGGVSIWGIEALTISGLSWLVPVVTVAVCPWLVSVGALSLARQRDLVSEPRALATIALSLCAFVLAALTSASWSLGFDAADRGETPTGFASAWPWLCGAAWLVGAAALGLFLDAILAMTRLRPFFRGLLSGVASVLAPVIGLSLISPTVSAIGAVAVAVLALAALPRRASGSQDTRQRGTAQSGASAAGTRGLVVALAVTAAVASAGGLVFAFTGSGWSPGGPDATAVMGQGISIALAAAVPFLAAIGVVATARSRHRPILTWGPLLLVCCSVAAVAGAYLNAPAWQGMAFGLATASVLAGSAIAWWVTPRLRGGTGVRVTMGVLIGVAYAALPGMVVGPTLAFVVPLLAAAFAIWGPRLWLKSHSGGVAPARLVAVPS